MNLGSLPGIGWTADDIPDQQGRVAIVTGGNSGLGFETAKALAKAGARVVLAVRTPAKGEVAAEAIVRNLGPGASVSVTRVDLSSVATVRAAADQLLADLDRLDLLINNAGIMATPPQLSVDGVELQFASNHLGHFALTGLLLPLLLATPSSRVVSVSSLAANSGSLIDHDPTSLIGYERFKAYGTTKLANQVFTAELDRRCTAAGVDVAAVAAHPGLAHTNLQNGFSLGSIAQTLTNIGARFVTQPASIGALATLRAATDPNVRSGDYFGPALPGEFFGTPKKLELLPTALDRETGRRLWVRSVELSGVGYAALEGRNGE
ncbi:MAG: oxidoreductase [Acidimicrobiales bacterium]